MDHHISIVLCNEDDCKTLPVPVWCLREILADQQSLPSTFPKPPTPGNRDLDALAKSLESDLQRFALLAFLSPDTRQVASSEWKLHAFWLKHFANQIAALNGHDGIRDIGGVITGFTQPGLKKDLGLLRKGEKSRSNGHRGRNYYLAAKARRWLLKMAAEANVLVPETWR